MWSQDETGRVHTPFEPVVLVATLALIPVLIIEADTKSDGWLTFTEVANWIIWAIFAMELTAVLVFAKRKRAALRAHWLDVAIVVLRSRRSARRWRGYGSPGSSASPVLASSSAEPSKPSGG